MRWEVRRVRVAQWVRNGCGLKNLLSGCGLKNPLSGCGLKNGTSLQSAHSLHAFSASSHNPLRNLRLVSTLHTPRFATLVALFDRHLSQLKHVLHTSLPQPGPLVHFVKMGDVTIVKVTPDVEPFPPRIWGLYLQRTQDGLFRWTIQGFYLDSSTTRAAGMWIVSPFSSTVSQLTFLARNNTTLYITYNYKKKNPPLKGF